MKGFKHHHWALMRAFMDGARLSVEQAGERIGCHAGHAGNHIRAMHAHQLIYVCGYERVGSQPVKIFAVRNAGQEDEPRPGRQPNATACDRYRQNKKALSGAVRLGMFGL